MDASSLSSQFLLRLQQMHPQAWVRLVESFSPLVYHWCRQSGLPCSDAADVVQDVFHSVARSIGSFGRSADQNSFRGWLATITRNRLIDHHRREQRQLASGDGGTDALLALAGVPDPQPDDSSSSLMAVQLAHRLLDLIRDEFQPQTWEAFRRTTLDGQPADQVAKDLGINIGSVYQARCRVLRRLRSRLGELPE